VEKLGELDGRLLVLFDGHCGLCNGTVRWLIRHDRRDRLRFAASEAPRGVEFLARCGQGSQFPSQRLSTILVVRDPGGPEENLLARSDAVLSLLRELPPPWPWIASTVAWIPSPLRDLGYRLIARWRYRIWGRLGSCPLPTTGQREKFL
jgi:predicted DCC family thiol-disulfide oxidoreductase YuxK